MPIQLFVVQGKQLRLRFAPYAILFSLAGYGCADAVGPDSALRSSYRARVVSTHLSNACRSTASIAESAYCYSAAFPAVGVSEGLRVSESDTHLLDASEFDQPVLPTAEYLARTSVLAPGEAGVSDQEIGIGFSIPALVFSVPNQWATCAESGGPAGW